VVVAVGLDNPDDEVLAGFLDDLVDKGGEIFQAGTHRM
jgi:hypothetical protein